MVSVTVVLRHLALAFFVAVNFAFARFIDFDLDSAALPLHEKKSTHDLNEFAMALNGASRLRYGKRSFGLYEQLLPQQFDSRQEVPEFTGQKRNIYSDPLALKLVQSLNGAERLRFGRR
uniref:Short neuropeptide F n=1 Tax=Steinernema glaseri TaxID=37863 RepID=A0A1I7Y924_9BILA